MSKQFLTPINLSGNALLNAVMNPLSGPPSSPVNGQVYYDTTLFQLLVWNSTASAWQNYSTNSMLLGGQNGAYYNARANATGTQLAATISNFAAAANALTLDTFAAPVAGVSMNNQRLTNVATPTASTDAANKSYVDISVQGLTAKPSARVATLAALPTNVYANGAAGVGATLTASAVGVLTIDGYAVALGDAILVKNEAVAANNGLYNVTTLGTASVAYVLTRNADMNSAANFGGAFIPVENLGTANANSLWLCNVANTITVGTTAVVFTQLNGATDLLQGNGITISGNTVSFLPDPAANKGLTVTGSGAAINFGGAYTWTGGQTFSAAVTANLGLTVAGAAFNSRGISDAAGATSLSILTSGVVSTTQSIQAQGTSSAGLTGVGTEIGNNGTLGFVQAYNRTSSAYMPLLLSGSTLSLAISGITFLACSSTGAVTINAPTSGQALTVAGFAGSSALQLTGTGMQVGSPTGGELGAGKINVAGGYFINGVAVNANSPAKYATAIGDGSTLTYTVTHNLGTQDVVASVYSATTPFAEVDCDINHATANTATFTFASAPTAGQFRVVLHG